MSTIYLKSDTDRPNQVRAIDLDTALHDLRNMAAIASELACDDIGSSHKKITGSDSLYHLTPRQRDRLLFAIYHVNSMADELLAAHNRGEVKA